MTTSEEIKNTIDIIECEIPGLEFYQDLTGFWRWKYGELDSADLDEKNTLIPIVAFTNFVNYTLKNVKLLKEIADTAYQITSEATSTEECLPPHPSYIVDGDLIRTLLEKIDQFMSKG